VKKGVEKPGIEFDGAGASRLDTETGLAPMPSLGVVPVVSVSHSPVCYSASMRPFGRYLEQPRVAMGRT
jgi:hypothetical protein